MNIVKLVKWCMLVGLLMCGTVFANDSSARRVLQLSETLLYQVKTGDSTAPTEQLLAALSKRSLQKALPDDAAKKTFWINLYNAWFQILAARGHRNPNIFQQKLIPVAGLTLSLEEIEQGILRKDFKRLRSLKLPGSFSKKILRRLAVRQVDCRIHFALNCGAVSCPPIAFYTYSRIHQQLEQATKIFLEGNTIIDHQLKKMIVTPLMDWYQEDFTGPNSVPALIGSVLKQNVTGYAITFSEYNWKEDLRNFIKE
jgi:hypothetical protein